MIDPSSNPRKIIQLDASGKQGRYVKIQLLDNDYLSLAEVQVMGVDPLHFSEVDYSATIRGRTCTSIIRNTPRHD
jgi:hypothetical protein